MKKLLGNVNANCKWYLLDGMKGKHSSLGKLKKYVKSIFK